ncbi:MAG: hypothetical protein AAB642_03130 [Patescibacteria group bacterium]
MKITLCGSMAFHAEMEKIGEQLHKDGHEVRVPLLRIEAEESGRDRKMSIRALIAQGGGVDAFPQDHPVWKEKSDAIDDHFAKVTWSDAILVVNYPKHEIDGYVGGNTLMEMAVAHYLKKKIYVLLPISHKISYKEEILGMHPTIIDENLSLIA